MIGNINSLRRQVKNVAYNYSDAQVKVSRSSTVFGYVGAFGREQAFLHNNK